MDNILADVPNHLNEEQLQVLLRSDNIRIERIVSTGQSSPEHGWYDQAEHEWVLVLTGQGILEFEDGSLRTLGPGDFVHIPKRVKHKVKETSEQEPTVWLAVFYGD